MVPGFTARVAHGSPPVTETPSWSDTGAIHRASARVLLALDTLHPTGRITMCHRPVRGAIATTDQPVATPGNDHNGLPRMHRRRSLKGHPQLQRAPAVLCSAAAAKVT